MTFIKALLGLAMLPFILTGFVIYVVATGVRVGWYLMDNVFEKLL
jgi:hypothetical protein